MPIGLTIEQALALARGETQDLQSDTPNDDAVEVLAEEVLRLRRVIDSYNRGVPRIDVSTKEGSE